MRYLALLALIAMPVWAKTKIPKNAHPVEHLWGWECDYGYIQNRNKCIKLKVPKNAVINEDGHTWSCKDGYEKYRDVCLKKK